MFDLRQRREAHIQLGYLKQTYHRWRREDNIKNCIKGNGVRLNTIRVAHNRVQCRALVNTKNEHTGFMKSGKYLYYLSD